MFRTISVYNYALNAISEERVDPLVALFLRLCGQADSQPLYQMCVLSILLAGLYLLYRRSGGSNSLLLASGVVAAVAFVVGWDPFVLKIQYFPWLLAAFADVRERGRLSSVIYATVAAFLWALTASSLGLVGILIAVLAVQWQLGREEMSEKPAGGRGFAVVVVVASVLCIALLPVYEMPDYPSSARLSADDALNVLPPPLIGPSLEPSSMLFTKYRELTRMHAVRFLFVSLAMLLSVAVLSRRIVRGFVPAACFMFVCFFVVFLECSLAPVWLAFSPYQSMARLIPGLALLPIAGHLFPLCIIVGALLFLREESSRRGLLPFAGLMLFVVLLEVVVGSLPIIGSQWYFADHFERNKKLAVASAEERLRFSPSSFVVRSFGPWVAKPTIVEKRRFNRLERLKKNKHAKWTLGTNVNGGKIHFADDSDAATRWSTGRAQQPGDYFEVAFDEPTEVVKVVLSTRHHRSDYPRGLSVSFWNGSEESWEILRHESWSGPLAWTTDGYPYFDDRAKVIIDLPEQIEATRLRFTQLGSHANFDWSIEELKLYRFPLSVYGFSD